MDVPRQIAFRAAPAAVRPALQALWDIDLAFAAVFRTTVMPHLGAIRLAWWRERLDELDEGVMPPAEPRLRAVASLLIPAGIKGAELSRLEDCWLALLAPQPWGETEAEAIAKRGAVLFGIAARLLGGDPAEAERLGVLWSLADAARGVGDAQSAALLRARAQIALDALPARRPSPKLAPLTMIAARRAYDLFNAHRGRLHRLWFGLRSSVAGKFAV